MRKVSNTKRIKLLEQHAMGSIEFDTLKVALESREDNVSVEESVAQFDTALQALELSFMREEIKNIAKDFQ